MSGAPWRTGIFLVRRPRRECRAFSARHTHLFSSTHALYAVFLYSWKSLGMIVGLCIHYVRASPSRCVGLTDGKESALTALVGSRSGGAAAFFRGADIALAAADSPVKRGKGSIIGVSRMLLQGLVSRARCFGGPRRSGLAPAVVRAGDGVRRARCFLWRRARCRGLRVRRPAERNSVPYPLFLEWIKSQSSFIGQSCIASKGCEFR